MVCLPYSKTKRYLTGIDWLIHIFDYMSRQETGVGNTSQLVLELDGSIEEEAFKAHLANFIKQYPVLCGKLKRDYNLAPYWKIPNKNPILDYTSRSFDTDQQAFLFLQQAVNTPLKGYCRFYYLEGKDKSFLAMTFDHRLFDARGAESFLELLQKSWQENILYTQPKLIEPAHLSQWRKKFSAGRQFNRLMIRLADKKRLLTLSLPENLKQRGFKFKLISFTKEQTSAIIDIAYSKAGYLMFTPYVLAIVAQGMHKIFVGRNLKEGVYIIPVSSDMRALDLVRQQLFFNHLSFLFFKFHANEIDDFDLLLENIKKQMYDQVKSNMLDSVSQSAFLMRIAPLSILAKLIPSFFRGGDWNILFFLRG